MSAILTYDSKETELNNILEIQKDIIARKTEDHWDIKGFYDHGAFSDFLGKAGEADLTCVDITQKNGVNLAADTRQKLKETMILLISDDSISPVSYMRPDIMAAALLMRPIKREDAYSVMKELICTYIDNQGDECFIIHNKEGDYRISYNQIICFESRQKKIFLRTKTEEIGFYDTMENLMQKLPDMFIRVHKSFIANKNRIDKVMFSENIIYMDESTMLPISRSYKQDVKVML